MGWQARLAGAEPLGLFMSAMPCSAWSSCSDARQRQAADRAVRPLLVVGEAEGVDLDLELANGRARGYRPSQRLRVWWKRSMLPWVWGWPGAPFFWRMPSQASRCSRPLRPPTKRAV